MADLFGCHPLGVEDDGQAVIAYDRRLLYVVADRTRLKAALDEARRRAEKAAELSATGKVA